MLFGWDSVPVSELRGGGACTRVAWSMASIPSASMARASTSAMLGTIGATPLLLPPLGRIGTETRSEARYGAMYKVKYQDYDAGTFEENDHSYSRHLYWWRMHREKNPTCHA